MEHLNSRLDRLHWAKAMALDVGIAVVLCGGAYAFTWFMMVLA